MSREVAVVGGALVATLLGGAAVAGAQAVADVHAMRGRLDEQQRGVGAMPDLQRQQIEITREQLASLRVQLEMSRQLLATSRRLQVLAAQGTAEAARARRLVQEVLLLEQRLADLTAEINRKQYQPPAPRASSPSR